MFVASEVSIHKISLSRFFLGQIKFITCYEQVFFLCAIKLGPSLLILSIEEYSLKKFILYVAHSFFSYLFIAIYNFFPPKNEI